MLLATLGAKWYGVTIVLSITANPHGPCSYMYRTTVYCAGGRNPPQSYWNSLLLRAIEIEIVRDGFATAGQSGSRVHSSPGST